MLPSAKLIGRKAAEQALLTVPDAANNISWEELL